MINVGYTIPKDSLLTECKEIFLKLLKQEFKEKYPDHDPIQLDENTLKIHVHEVFLQPNFFEDVWTCYYATHSTFLGWVDFDDIVKKCFQLAKQEEDRILYTQNTRG